MSVCAAELGEETGCFFRRNAKQCNHLHQLDVVRLKGGVGDRKVVRERESTQQE
jgi:hypothetical protein